MRISDWSSDVVLCRSQAVAQSRLGASIAGIDTGRASSIVFMASGVLAAVAGALLAPVINPAPDVGIFPAVKSYVIVVIGGMGSIPGSILAPLLQIGRAHV